MIAAETTDETLAPFTDNRLSNGKTGIDKDSDVFSKTNFSWMKHQSILFTYNQKIELETLSQIPLYITRPLDIPRFS